MTRTRTRTRTKIGLSETDYWLFSEEEGYDLSRGASLGSCRTIDSNKGALRIATSRSALLVVDMQNVFLHPLMRAHTAGLAALPRIQEAVEAARKAAIKVIWVNWGLMPSEVALMPPALAAGFTCPMPARLGQPKVFGQDMATEIDGRPAGRILMRHQWNTELYGPLQAMYEGGEQAGTDVWINKSGWIPVSEMSTLLTRTSRSPRGATDLGLYLTNYDIRTLFFTGVNTDYCVLGTFNEAFAKGFDCVLLKDGCGTTTPGEAQKVSEDVCGRHGFSMSVKDFRDGLERR